eukprot:364101-Chlamydomonas_euryale.AAC.8
MFVWPEIQAAAGAAADQTCSPDERLLQTFLSLNFSRPNRLDAWHGANRLDVYGTVPHMPWRGRLMSCNPV